MELKLDQVRKETEEKVKEQFGLETNDINDGLPKFQRNLIHALYRLEAQITGNLLLIHNQIEPIKEELRGIRQSSRISVQGGVLILSGTMIVCTIALCLVLILT